MEWAEHTGIREVVDNAEPRTGTETTQGLRKTSPSSSWALLQLCKHSQALSTAPGSWGTPEGTAAPGTSCPLWKTRGCCRGTAQHQGTVLSHTCFWDLHLERNIYNWEKPWQATKWWVERWAQGDSHSSICSSQTETTHTHTLNTQGHGPSTHHNVQTLLQHQSFTRKSKGWFLFQRKLIWDIASPI